MHCFDIIHLSCSALLYCQYPSITATLVLSSEEVWENATYSWPWGKIPVMVYIYVYANMLKHLPLNRI